FKSKVSSQRRECQRTIPSRATLRRKPGLGKTILASGTRAIQNGRLHPQFGRKPSEEGAHGALCIWIQELHSGILGAMPQAGKRPGSGVPTGIRTPVAS